MKQEITRFVTTLEKAIGPELESVIWYGPACQRPELARPEEVQLLVVVKKLGLPELQALSRPINHWVRKRHPFPKVFTLQRLLKSTDVFPIECLSIQSHYEVIQGTDIVPQLTFSEENLRLQLESEFKGKLLQLREAFLMCEGKPKILAQTMVVSLSAFETLFAALGRVLQQQAPATLEEAAILLATTLELQNSDVLSDIRQLRDGQGSRDKDRVLSIFERYLGLVEQVADKVDALQ